MLLGYDFLLWIIANAPFINGHSLNYLKNKYAYIKVNQKSSKFEKYVFKNSIKEIFLYKNSSESTLREIFNNPCVLTKIASHFDIRNLEIIVSQQPPEYEQTIAECQEVVTGNLRISISEIQGEENNFENLKHNLLQFLSREKRCYIVLCETVCNSLIMHLGYLLDYSSGIYLWITTEQPVFRKEIKYP